MAESSGAPAPDLMLKAPAKINLFLHVTGRRQDGYHELQSLFLPLSWHDRVAITHRSDGQISRSGNDAVAPESDLLLQAARLLQQQGSSSTLGAHFSISKRLPMGAGLGGGSSNAAAALIGLNRVWGLGLQQTELAALGLQLGADVPFFVHGQPALVSGIGEHVRPIELPAPGHLVLISPAVHIATPDIFRHEALCRSTPVMKEAHILQMLAQPDGLQQLMAMSRNDLQGPACLLHPALSLMTTMIKSEFNAEARMTGSGSNFFVCCADATSAEQLKDDLNEWFASSQAAGLQTLHPLRASRCSTA